MDKFNDFYAEPNYTRLFLLFFCFLLSLFYYMTGSAYDSVMVNHKESIEIQNNLIIFEKNLDEKN